jgi:hypothetical protein
MNDESRKVVDRATWQAEVEALRVQERRTLAKETRLQPPVAGCQWWRWTPLSR